MASNARFHNKYHRRNHHTLPSAGYPDSGADPIASPQEPFLGDFHAVGALSATGNLTIGGNTLIYGNLSALGNFSFIDTFVTVTSALSVVNDGTGPAFTVQQKGAQPVAIFFDDSNKIFNLKDGLRAEFFNSNATNTYALAEGQATLAQGNASHSEGISTQAFGQGSHAEGAASTATGDYSHAEGDATQAIGNASHSEGDSTVASGNASHAEGTATFASNNSTHAEGYSTSATGLYSHSEGSGTKALGTSSHAEGESTIASGDTSHAEGLDTKALGDFSHAEGEKTVASGVNSHAAGRWAQAAHDRTWIWKGATGVDLLSTTRADQFMVSAAGGIYLANQVGIGTDSIANALTVVGNVSASRSVVGTSLSGRFVDISHTPANDGSNPYLRIGEATSDAVNFSGFKIEYNETANDLNLSAIGFNTSKEALKITSAGNTRINLLSAVSPNYVNLTAVTRGISGAGFDNLSHLINGRIGVNNQAPVSSYALHVKGGNIRVDGVDFSAVPGFDGTIYDSDGQSLFDLRSAQENANYSLSIASSGLNNFMKFFGGRSLDQNPFVAVRKGQPIRFAQMNNFYGQGFSEVARIGGNGNVSIGLSADGAERLTVLGNISASGTLSAGGVGNSYFAGNVGIGTTVPAAKLTVAGSISSNGTLSASGTGGNYFTGAVTVGDPVSAIKFIVAGNGNVGINTATPNEQLTVSGNISANGYTITTGVSVLKTNAGADAAITVLAGNNSGDAASIFFGNNVAVSGHNRGQIRYYNGGIESMAFSTATVEAMRIRSTGNVGIGTTLPAEKLTVSGNISSNGTLFTKQMTAYGLDLVHIPITDGTDPILRIGESSTDSPNLGFSGAHISYDEITNTFGISSVFAPGMGMPAIAIDRNSNVGIGTTLPAERLTVSGNISANGSLFVSGLSANNLTVSDNISASGNLIINGNTTLGDSNLDTLTLNGTSVSIPNNLNFDANTLFIDAANNRVGIGTNTPEQALHVLKASAGTVTADSNSIAVFEGNTSNHISILTPDSQTGGLVFGSPTDNYGSYLSWNHDNNALKLATAKTAGFIQLLTNSEVEAVRITNSGNVGIGTTVPAAKLTVSGNISASGSVDALSSNVGIVVNDKTTSYTFTNEDNCKIVHFNTTTQSLCAIFPSSLRTDFNCAVMNTGTNVLTLSTYTTLRAIAPNISTQYGAAFVYKDSSNNIYAVGRL